MSTPITITVPKGVVQICQRSARGRRISLSRLFTELAGEYVERELLRSRAKSAEDVRLLAWLKGTL